jgi:hypothetical protein
MMMMTNKGKMERKATVHRNIYHYSSTVDLPCESEQSEAVLLCSTFNEQRAARIATSNKPKPQAIKPATLAKNEQASKHTHA